MRSLLRAAGSARLAAAGTLVVALLIGGCAGSGPSQPGAAAIVGGTAVSVEQVQTQLDTVLNKEGKQVRAQLVAGRQLDDVSRQIVTLLIRHELIKTVARREGLSVDAAQVSKLLYDKGGPEVASRGTIWDAQGFRVQARDELLMQQLGRKTLHTAVTFDYTTAATRTAALQRADELAAAGSRQARAMVIADVNAKKDALVSKRVVGGDDPIFAASPAFGVATNNVVAFQLADNQPWLITVIRNRTEDAQPSAQAPDPNQIDPAVLESVGLRQLGQVAQDLGVRLNPRYGVWDQVNLKAVSNKDEVGGVVVPLSAGPRT
ncbi:MAG: SurA N-terminal domain-containing protein [Pseudonocardiaceae bacterium]